MGSPDQSRQNVSVVPDTGSLNLWVIDSACDTGPCNGFLSFYTRRKFNTTESSTFSVENRSIAITYGFGWFDGLIGKDTVSFAGDHFIANIFGYVPIDGILGLAWPTISVGNVTPPMQNPFPVLDAPIFTVWLDRKVSNGGLITYGGIDSTNCEEKIDYVSLTSKTYWQFAISGFSIGSYSTERIYDVGGR
ncbi:unnamed protein product [Angiostrongylus costaricensis]|uniref:Peptidase A1 domain-containing protein n=1 Tax=Angiostrongylus costaricensis TaxID=334426 RepID=A0A0R3PZ33_ANGCS|nr:unnamed protein product [Angiostrongylus costaricensis]